MKKITRFRPYQNPQVRWIDEDRFEIGGDRYVSLKPKDAEKPKVEVDPGSARTEAKRNL